MSSAPAWPDNLIGYKRTSEFTETTVPAALLRDHATKDGVWARLHVLAGTLHFIDQASGQESILQAGIHQVIFPGRLHRVAPIGNVRFLVEFCRPQESGVDPAADADQTFPHR